MQKIFESEFGSRLYGTSLPDSDYDVRSVFLPSCRDILLSTVNDDQSGVNGEIDWGMTSLQRFLKHIAGGQALYLDLFFAPESSWKREPHPIWFELHENKDRIINSKCSGMLGFFNKQAEANNLRVEKYNKLNQLIHILENSPKTDNDSWDDSVFEEIFALDDKHFSFEDKKVGVDVEQKPKMVKHLVVYEKSYPVTSSSATLLHQLKGFRDKYGNRIKNAGERKDWKAIYHSVRIGYQIVELLDTGHITFPNPKAEWLLRVRKGEIAYEDVEVILKSLDVGINKSLETTSIPKNSDMLWIDNFVFQKYRDVVVGNYA